jgi:hypothetical protein
MVPKELAQRNDRFVAVRLPRADGPVHGPESVLERPRHECHDRTDRTELVGVFDRPPERER